MRKSRNKFCFARKNVIYFERARFFHPLLKYSFSSSTLSLMMSLINFDDSLHLTLVGLVPATSCSETIRFSNIRCGCWFSVSLFRRTKANVIVTTNDTDSEKPSYRTATPMSGRIKTDRGMVEGNTDS